MQERVELTKQTYENLIAGLVQVEEVKEDLLKDFFPDEIKERNKMMQTIENYISCVSQLAQNIKISETADNKLPMVLIGSEVDLEDLDYNETTKLRIMLPGEDMDIDDASCLSPIGTSLLLKKVGEEIAVQTPGGVCRYRVNAISLPYY
ncbi:Transcription elongation factor GreB [Sporotomaculum syntrophicum]|uniref:Transcription elongation factor GreB n=1 Tax=Sporotomaculum syntrophicum TaxID=182264 RepID=A0A9D3AX19_9FIRM|nr:GreA/GreB family elongation factor [Sporotomaculum syntrophicum]KAF1083906.1 Transcription elongation factor GreB [Sporotomaculum syntrophicum]